MRILMASAEMVPLAKTGGLGDVVGALPIALAAMGHEVTVVMPYYGSILGKKYAIAPTGDWFDAWVGQQHYFGGLHLWTPAPGVTVILVKQDELFSRPGIYGDSRGGYWDNHRRFIFLSFATLEVARRRFISGRPFDIFHGHDWHVGLIPLYLKEGRAGYAIPSVFSIHNLQYQGRYGSDMLWDAGLSPQYNHPDLLELYGSISFMKAGLVYADCLSTVSRAYAREIQSPEYGGGLEGLIHQRRHRLVGIVNGIDMAVWDPMHDPALASPYGPGKMQGKSLCKQALQLEFGLPPRDDVPLFTLVSRLTDQKGIYLIDEVMPRLLAEDVQFVMLGSGERRFEDMFRFYAARRPRQVGIKIGFDESMAHRVEAGGDIFVMPSRFEPCGLNQLYSLRYGNVPVVRAVGGLDDTIEDYNPATDSGNGFKFQSYDANGLWWALRRALLTYENREEWDALRQRIMLQDFSWEHAAREYLELYHWTQRIADQ